MSEQINPVPAEERESASGLLLSVKPLHEDTKLYAESNEPIVEDINEDEPGVDEPIVEDLEQDEPIVEDNVSNDADANDTADADG